MKIALILFFALIVLGCIPSQTKHSPAIIVADGTEVQQFEQLMFCGDMEAFVKASNLVHEPLKNAWDELLGQENQEFCSITVSLNKAGDIVGYSIVECENPNILPKIIERASPIKVPESECLLDRVQGIEYTINGKK